MKRFVAWGTGETYYIWEKEGRKRCNSQGNVKNTCQAQCYTFSSELFGLRLFNKSHLLSLWASWTSSVFPGINSTTVSQAHRLSSFKIRDLSWNWFVLKRNCEFASIDVCLPLWTESTDSLCKHPQSHFLFLDAVIITQSVLCSISYSRSCCIIH